MKFAMLFSLLLAGFAAQALPAQTTVQRPFDLMKCTSKKNGTMWASFGHTMRSGEDVIRYFPTEIIIFAENFSDRIVFKGFDGDSNALVSVRGTGFVRLQVSFSQGGQNRVDTLQLMLADPRVPNSFAGNWTVTVDGGEPVMDLASCTLH